jgi:LmbE family N-acetylglucosaminyl deacetylase
MFLNKVVLILAPHTDDGEFGCGGTISRIIREGGLVHYVAFSAAEDSVPAALDKNILRVEVKNATKYLGIKSDNLLISNFSVRRFNYFRQEILDEMVVLNRKLAPDIVFVPSRSDTHQDHKVVSEESFRAFKKSTILGYELPWNNINFPTDLYVKLKSEDIENKINSIRLYESQKERIYSKPEVIKSLAITRGTQIGCEFAEAYEVIRIVL